MAEPDHVLDFLLTLDGFEFRMDNGYVVELAARAVVPTPYRPQGVKYSLTLHDRTGRRIYGMDNAHGLRGQTEYDHRHVYGSRTIRGYRFHGPAELLADFYREVERILAERGLS